MNIYISSYDKEKKGIYVCGLENDSLTLKEYIPTEDFPSYIIKDEDFIYASLKDGRSGNGGGVCNYKIVDDTLDLYSQFDTHGRSYTHLCLSPDKKYVFTANYHAGTTASFIMDDYKILDKISVQHHIGQGPDPLKRQMSAHVHYVGITPDKKYVYAVDLGSDKVALYTYKDGILQETEKNLEVVGGSGPRHMIFTPNGKFAYIVNEIANQIMSYQYVHGRFSLVQIIKTIPSQYTDFTCAAAIRMTSSGKHLIVSNRGHNSLTFYRINQESGKLLLLGFIPTGKEPRDFNIINDQYVIVASQEENYIEIYNLDEENEHIEPTGKRLEIPSPVCIAY